MSSRWQEGDHSNEDAAAPLTHWPSSWGRSGSRASEMRKPSFGGAGADGQAGRRVFQRGDHRPVCNLYLEGHPVGRAVEEAEQLGMLGVGHVQDAPARVPESGDVEEEPSPTSGSASLNPDRPSRS